MPIQSNSVCSVCRYGYLMEPNNGQESYLQCNECGTIQLTYLPLPHQVEFHTDNHKYRAFFGKPKSAEVKHDKIGETLTV